MNRSALIVFLVVVVALYTCEANPPRKICTGGPHDKWTNCGSACEPSCEKPGPRACILICELNTCRCEKDTVRRWDGQCVALKDCNKY